MTAPAPAVRKEIDGSRGRYVIETEEGTADLTISILSPALVIADHTAVPKALEGQGYARILLEHLLEDARRDGFRIVPLCPFVNAQRARHPEWEPLFST